MCLAVGSLRAREEEEEEEKKEEEGWRAARDEEITDKATGTGGGAETSPRGGLVPPGAGLRCGERLLQAALGAGRGKECSGFLLGRALFIYLFIIYLL